MKHLFALLVLALVAFVPSAHAEGGCPPGSYPQRGQGWQGCAPIPGYQQQDEAESTSAVWESRWQAIAADVAMQRLGTSVNELSEKNARTDALLDCQRKGGTNCEIQLSLANACAAMAVGTKTINVKAGLTKGAAEASANIACTARDTHCQNLYSACSQAERVR
jgi:hypothetical protein